MKVAIIEGVRPTLMPEGPEIERKVLGEGADIRCYGMVRPEEYEAVLGELDAVITRPGTPFSEAMISFLKKARAIISLGVGYEHIDIKAANRRGIMVCNVPSYGTEEVADTAVAMMLAHQRKLNLFGCLAESCGEAGWDWRIYRPIRRMRNVRVGIIGLGRIGTAVALRLKGFGPSIGFYDPYIARGFEKAVGLERLRDIDELICSSDIISIHAPLTAETRAMVDGRFLDRMKPEGILINTARGGIFESADTLFHYLKAHPHMRIGADVWPDEPPRDDPLIRAWMGREGWLGDRLIISPHAAFYSESAVHEMRSLAAEAVKAVLAGGAPFNVVSGE